MRTPHRFGGTWTDEKLDTLRKYLAAYRDVMKKQRFHLMYIDAFAGTGYRDAEKEPDAIQQSLLEEFSEEETQNFLKGSAVIALEQDPPFHEFIFIERKRKHAKELERLKSQFPEKADSIKIVKGDSNLVIKRLCADNGWRSKRAVLFLDPYGMQVEWETLKAIAETKAIDLWILFPAAIGVNRMLPRHGKAPDTWEKRLDRMFGTKDWRDRFYSKTRQTSFIEDDEKFDKVATIEEIGEFFNERLKTIFPGVAPNARTLSRPDGAPLYQLCFAAANKKGSEIAIKIASHLLEK